MLFATAASGPGFPKYHLTAERLPSRDVWTWEVWQRGLSGTFCRHGGSPSADAAMADAQEAVTQLDRDRPRTVFVMCR